MLKVFLFLFLLSSAFSESTTFAYERIFNLAKKDFKWKKCKTLSEQMWLVRSYASKEAVVSKKVSDRYQITAYGGPIDLVHFLCLSNYVASGRYGLEDSLYRQWLSEGGKDHEYGFVMEKKQEAHPDDLPSNALGALWGSELKKHNNDLSFDLQKSFEAFIKGLKPVPRKIAQEYSHREIVMGLPKSPNAKQIAEKYGWYTATPFNQYSLINEASQKLTKKDFCKEFKSYYEGLLFAGFYIDRYKGKAIVIRRH